VHIFIALRCGAVPTEEVDALGSAGLLRKAHLFLESCAGPGLLLFSSSSIWMTAQLHRAGPPPPQLQQTADVP